jgi:hypothetical protein
MVTYATDLVYEEVAYLAYHLHWSYGDLLDLEHAERQRFVNEVGRLSAEKTQGR